MATRTRATQSHDAPIPRVAGGLPWLGHIASFARNPYHFVKQAADTTGEVAAFKLLGQRIILLTGRDASELFYRSSDEQLDQSAAYRLMTPIFGKGLVFDAPNERKNEQLRMLMPSLRVDAMRQHSSKVVKEVEDIISDWGESGEIDLVDFMKQLTINTASHCLLGKEFRYELNEEFAEIYRDLERGVHPLAYHYPNLPLPRFKRRDRARQRLQKLVGDIVRKRKQQADKPDDMFQHLIDTHYEDGTRLTDSEITGMLIATIFAGHHTSSGTSSWVLLELLKHPQLMNETRAELDELLGRNGEVTFTNLRKMPLLDNILKEVLRLHPPLIILMRQVCEDLHFNNHTLKKGDMVWASPPVTHRMADLFPNPEVFDPDRYTKNNRADRDLMAYQPFGGGKHKCLGNAFATFQIKAIFAVLLRRCDFELVDAPATYRDNYKDMIVQPMRPCRIRFRRRDPATIATAFGTDGAPHNREETDSGCPAHDNSEHPAAARPKTRTVTVDRGLCQGHGVCTDEAPTHFRLDNEGKLELLKASVSPDEVHAVQSACENCPTQALQLVEQ